MLDILVNFELVAYVNKFHRLSIELDLTRFNKIVIQGTPQMAVDKETICLSRVYSYSNSKCTLTLY